LLADAAGLALPSPRCCNGRSQSHIGKAETTCDPQSDKETKDVDDKEDPVYYTARHLLQALSNLEDRLLDLPLVLIHGKDLSKPNLVSGIIPAPVPVERGIVEEKKPALLALAELQSDRS
jgi:hypothetical protein